MSNIRIQFIDLKTQGANKSVKNPSDSLVIKETEIKTVRCFISTQLTTIKHLNYKGSARKWRNKPLGHCLQQLLRLELGLPCDPTIPTISCVDRCIPDPLSPVFPAQGTADQWDMATSRGGGWAGCLEENFNWDASQVTQCQKPVLPGNETGDQNPANLGQPLPK